MDRAEKSGSAKVTALTLALDCCSLAPSAALTQDGRLVASAAGCAETGSVELLLELCSEVLDSAGCRRSELTGLAVTIGPGSFTGIRTSIGSAAGIAAGMNLPVTGISQPLALAVQAISVGLYPQADLIAVSSSANPNEDFAAWFRVGQDGSAALITAMTAVVSIKKGILSSAAIAAAGAEVEPAIGGLAADRPVLIEANSYYSRAALNPAAITALAVSALAAGSIRFAGGSSDPENRQLQFGRPGPGSGSAIMPLYGKPVNAKTLAERGLAAPRC